MSPPQSLEAVLLLCRPDLSLSELSISVGGASGGCWCGGVAPSTDPSCYGLLLPAGRPFAYAYPQCGRPPGNYRKAITRLAGRASTTQSLLRRATTTYATTATVTRTWTTTRVARTGTRTRTTTAVTATTTTCATTSGICAGALRPRGEDRGLLRVNRHDAPSPRVRCIGRPGYGSSSFSVTPHRRPRAMCPPAEIAT